jgi:Leucine-rich repeat (LRR) protein
MPSIDNALSIDLTVCTWLHELCVSGSGVQQLPSSIVLLTDLRRLDFSYNRLTSIDEIDFATMSKLTTLNVSEPIASQTSLTTQICLGM